MCKSIKPVGTALGAMYGLCKIQKQELDGVPYLGKFYRPYRLPYIILLSF